MMFTPKFTITNRMTQAITRIERARGFMEAAQLSADWVREMEARALILEAQVPPTPHAIMCRQMINQPGSIYNQMGEPDDGWSPPGRQILPSGKMR